MAVPERTLTPELIAALSDAVQRGQVPAFGGGQGDTFYATDNLDATHPLNIRYIIPGNVQRVTAARLSFHLAAFRSYEVGVAAVTTAGTNHYHISISTGAGAITQNLGFTAGGDIGASGAGGGAITSTEVASNPDVPDSNTHALGPFTAAGHTHTFTPALTYGVFEGATAASVTISFDGVSRTTALGGPWSADVVEMDVRAYISTVTGVYHTIALQPTGLGRIEAHLRFSYYADARSSI